MSSKIGGRLKNLRGHNNLLLNAQIAQSVIHTSLMLEEHGSSHFTAEVYYLLWLKELHLVMVGFDGLSLYNRVYVDPQHFANVFNVHIQADILSDIKRGHKLLFSIAFFWLFLSLTFLYLHKLGVRARATNTPSAPPALSSLISQAYWHSILCMNHLLLFILMCM